MKSHRISKLECVFETLRSIPDRCPHFDLGKICDCSKLEDLDREILETLSNLAKKRRVLTTRINQNHDPYIHRLPSEIASQIFLFYKDINCPPTQKSTDPVPYSDPLRSLLQVASVCKIWHEIMFATPELWTSINIFAYAIPIPLHVELAEQWLARAGALPLSITVYCNQSSISNEAINPDDLSPLFEVLRRHHAQWRELTLYLPMDFYPCFQGDLTGAPILETFRLLPAEEYTTHASHQLLLPNTPRLFHLEISYPRLVDIKPQWDGLTYFEAEAVSVEELLYLLEMAPLLVYCSAGGVNDLPAFGIPDKPITHTSLKELHFAPYPDLAAISTLFDKIVLPALEHFIYTAPAPLNFPMVALCSLFNRSQSHSTHFTFIGRAESGQFDDHKVTELLEAVPTIIELQIWEILSYLGNGDGPPPAIVSEHLVQWSLERKFTLESHGHLYLEVLHIERPALVTSIRRGSDSAHSIEGELSVGISALSLH
jgi:hypothetical protein